MSTFNSIVTWFPRLIVAAMSYLGVRWLIQRTVVRTRDGTLGVLIRMERPHRAVHPGFTVVVPGVDRIEPYNAIRRPWTDVVSVHTADVVPFRLHISIMWSIGDVLSFHRNRLAAEQIIVASIQAEAAEMSRHFPIDQVMELPTFEGVFAQRLHARLLPIGVRIDAANLAVATFPASYYAARGAVAVGGWRRDALEVAAHAQSAVEHIEIATSAHELTTLSRIGHVVDDRTAQLFESRSVRAAATSGHLTVINAQPVTIAATTSPPPTPPPAPVSTPRPAAPTPSPAGRHRDRRSSR